MVKRDLDPRSAVSELDEDGPELVVVVAGDDREEALRLIGFVRHERQLPVVAAIEHADIEWTVAAVSAGACGAVIGAGPESVRAAVHAACEHFAELRRLEEALERRAVIERAKGVLMATRGIGGEDAYILLRDHSRRTNQKPSGSRMGSFGAMCSSGSSAHARLRKRHRSGRLLRRSRPDDALDVFRLGLSRRSMRRARDRARALS